MLEGVSDAVGNLGDAVGVADLVPDVVSEGVDLVKSVTGISSKCSACDGKIKAKVQLKLRKCLNAAIKISNKNFATVTTTDEAEEFTCQFISDMDSCHHDSSLELCYSSKEIQNMKDILISRQISEFVESESEIDIEECEKVKEYIESKRADNMNKSGKVGCSKEVENDISEWNCV